MVFVVVLLLSLVISYIDLRTHRIPNCLNAILLCALIFDRHRMPLGYSVVLFAFILLISILLRVGGGDIKLLGVLILTQGRYVASFAYLQGLIIAISLMVVVTAVYRRSLQGSIALAPVILAPFLWLYLEI